jgi:hypothetical protein
MAEAPSITVPLTTGRTPLCNEDAVEKINRGTSRYLSWQKWCRNVTAPRQGNDETTTKLSVRDELGRTGALSPDKSTTGVRLVIVT